MTTTKAENLYQTLALTWMSTGKALKSIWQMKVILLASAYITTWFESIQTPAENWMRVFTTRHCWGPHSALDPTQPTSASLHRLPQSQSRSQLGKTPQISWLRQDWLDYNIHIFQAICHSYKSYYMHLPISRESYAFQKTSGPWSPGQESKAWAECSHSPLPWWKACRPDWRSSPRLPDGRDWRWVCDPATSRWSRRRAWWRSLGPIPTALTSQQTSLSLKYFLRCIACTAMQCFVLWELKNNFLGSWASLCYPLKHKTN